MYKCVVFFVPSILSTELDCELKVLVFRGATINGWDQGPFSESARNATTSESLANQLHKTVIDAVYLLFGLYPVLWLINAQ